MLAYLEFRRHAVGVQEKVKMRLPLAIRNFTDFYASKEHATNVGSMFRDPKSALNPNWCAIVCELQALLSFMLRCCKPCSASNI